LRTIILPKRNEQDLDDVPDEIKKSMKFIYAETVDDVLESALEANHKRSGPVDKRSRPVDKRSRPVDKRSRPADKPTRAKSTLKKKSASRKTKTNGKDTARRR
jgi:predicted ATP-dependent protease